MTRVAVCGCAAFALLQRLCPREQVQVDIWLAFCSPGRGFRHGAAFAQRKGDVFFSPKITSRPHSRHLLSLLTTL